MSSVSKHSRTTRDVGPGIIMRDDGLAVVVLSHPIMDVAIQKVSVDFASHSLFPFE